MASSPPVNPVKKEKKIITSEAYIQTLQSQGHLCEISKMLDDFSEHIRVQQLQKVLEELTLLIHCLWVTKYGRVVRVAITNVAN